MKQAVPESTKMKRLRVLISAHEFSPYQGSECARGWQIPTLMARYHDVTVLCASGSQQQPNKYRDDVMRYCKENGQVPDLEIIFVDQPAITLLCAGINRLFFSASNGLGFRPLFYFGYSAWHRAALRRARSLDISAFDLVHQLVPLTFRCPGYLWRLPLPFFWGPIGGMYKVPFRFAHWVGLRFFIYELFRSFCNRWQTVTSRSIRGAMRNAVAIWTITPDEQRWINKTAGNKSGLMLEVAPRPEVIGRVRQYDPKIPLHICWSGLHVARKALPFLLHAVASLDKPGLVFLDVLGKGPETQKWKTLSERLGLKSAVQWHGWLAHTDALQKMNEADLFVQTSIGEGTSNVVLEALGWGLPVICHDTCGMAIAVDETCGIKVPLVSPGNSIDAFRQALERIILDPPLLEKLSRGAIKRASALSWESKVREMSEKYADMLGNGRR